MRLEGGKSGGRHVMSGRMSTFPKFAGFRASQNMTSMRATSQRLECWNARAIGTIIIPGRPQGQTKLHCGFSGRPAAALHEHMDDNTWSSGHQQQPQHRPRGDSLPTTPVLHGVKGRSAMALLGLVAFFTLPLLATLGHAQTAALGALALHYHACRLLPGSGGRRRATPAIPITRIFELEVAAAAVMLLPAAWTAAAEMLTVMRNCMAIGSALPVVSPSLAAMGQHSPKDVLTAKLHEAVLLLSLAYLLSIALPTWAAAFRLVKPHQTAGAHWVHMVAGAARLALLAIWSFLAVQHQTVGALVPLVLLSVWLLHLGGSCLRAPEPSPHQTRLQSPGP